MRMGSRERGLTLLELLVAFAIMAMSLGLLYRAMGGSARSAGDVERYQHAVLLAESLLALRDTVPEQGWADAGETGGYRWRVQSAPYSTGLEGPNIPVLHEVGILITWFDGTQDRSFEIATLRPQRKPPEPGRIR